MQKAVKDEALKPGVEKLLEDIDSGKAKTTRYKTAKDYLEHVEKDLSG